MLNLMKRTLTAATMAVLAVSLAGAATLPDENSTTTMTATVSEQAQLTTPATVSFTVDDITSPTAATAVSVSATSIALSTDLKKLKISLAPNTAAFSKPTGALVGWVSSDVSFTSTGTAWTQNNSTLSAIAGTYVAVATCTANATSCSSSDLTFTLAANSGIDGSGDFALAVTWKFESI